jgi:hypothetical protein
MARACSAADSQAADGVLAEKRFGSGDSVDATENFGVLSANSGTSERRAGGEIRANGRGASVEGMGFTSALGDARVSAGTELNWGRGAGTLAVGEYFPFHEARKNRLTRATDCTDRRALCEFN